MPTESNKKKLKLQEWGSSFFVYRSLNEKWLFTLICIAPLCLHVFILSSGQLLLSKTYLLKVDYQSKMTGDIWLTRDPTSKQGALPCASSDELNGSGSKVVQICPAHQHADTPAFHTRLQGTALDGKTEQSHLIAVFQSLKPLRK